MSAAVVLADIRSVHNVGSIFRTCDAAGVDRIYLAGLTPSPIDRFGRARKDLAKTALGAEKTVSWTHAATTEEAIAELRAADYQIVAVELDGRAVSYRAFNPGEKVAYIFGNEVGGISEDILNRCDVIVQIPMHGAKESLNVAVAAGIILFAHQ